MSRKLSTLVLLGALIGVLFVGCGFLDGPLTDVPLAPTPNAQPIPGRPPTPSAGERTVFATPVFIGRDGTAIPFTCNADIVNCEQFKCQQQAQAYFEALNQAFQADPDCQRLDEGGDPNTACEGVPGPLAGQVSLQQWLAPCQ